MIDEEIEEIISLPRSCVGVHTWHGHKLNRGFEWKRHISQTPVPE